MNAATWGGSRDLPAFWPSQATCWSPDTDTASLAEARPAGRRGGDRHPGGDRHRGGRMDRLPLVPVGSLLIRVRYHLRHTLGAVLRRRPVHGARRGLQRHARLPAQADVPAGGHAGAGPGGLPDLDRPAPPAAARSDPRDRRTDLRPDRFRLLAYLAAVRQPGSVWCERSPVPPGYLVLRVYLPLHPDGADLPVRGGTAVTDRGGDSALPVRRGAVRGPPPAGDGSGAGSAVRAVRYLRPAEGGGLLGRPVRH